MGDAGWETDGARRARLGAEDGQRELDARGRRIRREDVQDVVGEHPVLEPGECFEYMSAAVIDTDRGYMEGEFEFELRQGFCPPLVFEAEIARFLLDTDICEQL